MIKHLLFYSLLLMSTGVHAQTTLWGIPNCIARWDFTSNGSFSTLPDVSGNANNGSAINIQAAQGFQGISNTAGKFNGTSSQSIVPNAPLLNPSIMTIVTLIKFDGFYSGLCNGNNIISKGLDHGSQGDWELFVADNDVDCDTYSPTTETTFFRTAYTTGLSTHPVTNFCKLTNGTSLPLRLTTLIQYLITKFRLTKHHHPAPVISHPIW